MGKPRLLKAITIGSILLLSQDHPSQPQVFFSKKWQLNPQAMPKATLPLAGAALALAPSQSILDADQAAEKLLRTLFSEGDFAAMELLVNQQLQNLLLTPDYRQWVRAQIPAMKLGQAWSMIRQRKCLDAIPLLEEVQQIQAHSLAVKGLGYCHMQNKDYAEASQFLERYLEQEKNDPEAYILLAETKESLGATSEALELAQRARTLQNLTSAETKDLQLREESLSIKTEESYGQAELTAGFIQLRYQSRLHQHLVAGSLEILQHTIAGLNHQLGLAYPAEPIEVIFHPSENFQRVTHIPSWGAGLYDGRVRIPVQEGQIIDEPFAKILRHEITHAVLAEQVQRRHLPAWWQEGLAQVAECPELCWRYRFAATQFPFLPVAAFHKEFLKLSQDDAQVAYKQSFYLMQVLYYQFGGITNLKLILDTLPTTEDLSSDGILQAIGQTFAKIHQTALRNWGEQRSF